MRIRASLAALLILASSWSLAHAQQPLSDQQSLPADGQPLSTARIVRLDPSLDRIVSQNEKVYVVKGENSFGITDGNVWLPSCQCFLFSDIVANVIYQYSPATQKLSVFLNNSGYTGSMAKVAAMGYLARSGPFYVYDFGSNGIAIDPQGRVVFVAQGDRAIVRLEPDGKRTVLANKYQGKHFNRPNKLAIRSDGTIYFSDLAFPTCADCQLSYPQALYMLKDGKVTLLEQRGHGVTLSPDQKVLYVGTNKPGVGGSPAGGIIMRYDIQADDTLANGRVLVDMSGPRPPGEVSGGPDGFAVDREGNIYSGGPGGMWIINPQGKHIGTIILPQSTTNVGFGGQDMKTLFLLDRRNLLKIQLKIAGVLPPSGPVYRVAIN